VPRGEHRRKTLAEKTAAGTVNVTKERRFARQAAAVAAVERANAAEVPAPPKDLRRAEVAVWRELAEQINAVGSYTPQSLSAFRALVVVTARIRDRATSPTSIPSLSTTQARYLASFGLDPATRARRVAAELEHPPEARYPHGEPVPYAEQLRIQKTDPGFFRPLPPFTAKNYPDCYPKSEGGTRPD